MKLTKSEIVDARDWLLDCCFSEEDVEFVENCSDEEIERLVSRHFSGGLEAFLESYGPNYSREA
jgi:hypothetical protein